MWFHKQNWIEKSVLIADKNQRNYSELAGRKKYLKK